MTRRLIPFVVAVAAILAACSGTSSAPALTDPKEILSKTAASLQDVKTVHVKAQLAGKVDPSIATGGAGGTGGAGAFDLTGSTLEGDIDIKGSQAHLTATVPTLLSLTAELIATGGNAYLKTSLTGDKYQKLDSSMTSALPLPSLPISASPDPSAAAAMLDQVKAELDKLSPTKLDDVKCGDQDCYHVQLKLSSADVPDASALPSGMAGNVTLDVYSRKSDYRPAQLVIGLDAGTQANLTVTVDLSNYDAAVTVTPPPADQISDQPFSIPGLTP